MQANPSNPMTRRTPHAEIVRTVAGRERRFLVFHDAIFDRVELLCDGEALKTERRRRMFSLLTRFVFDLDGEALELRIRATMTHPIYELARAGDALTPTKLGWRAYAFIACLVPLIAWRGRVMFPETPLSAMLVIALVAFAFTSGLFYLLDRRSRR